MRQGAFGNACQNVEIHFSNMVLGEYIPLPRWMILLATFQSLFMQLSAVSLHFYIMQNLFTDKMKLIQTPIPNNIAALCLWTSGFALSFAGNGTCSVACEISFPDANPNLVLFIKSSAWSPKTQPHANALNWVLWVRVRQWLAEGPNMKDELWIFFWTETDTARIWCQFSDILYMLITVDIWVDIFCISFQI